MFNMDVVVALEATGLTITCLHPATYMDTTMVRRAGAGRVIGSVFMTAIGFATAVIPLGTAIALFSTLAHARMIVMLLLLPETRGRGMRASRPRRDSPRSLRLPFIRTRCCVDIFGNICSRSSVLNLVGASHGD